MRLISFEHDGQLLRDNHYMGKFIYLRTTSLDGFAADKNGDLERAKPGEEVHAFVHDIVRNAGTFLPGRNMYERKYGILFQRRQAAANHKRKEPHAKANCAGCAGPPE